METFIEFAVFGMATVLALFSALALQALLMRAVLALMEPATADRRIAPPSMARGTQMVARAYAKAR
jgi:hypothetical protein